MYMCKTKQKKTTVYVINEEKNKLSCVVFLELIFDRLSMCVEFQVIHKHSIHTICSVSTSYK